MVRANIFGLAGAAALLSTAALAADLPPPLPPPMYQPPPPVAIESGWYLRGFVGMSNQFLDRIRVPALLVQAKDDPLIPFEVYDHPAFARNPHLRLLTVEHGGHVGFISKTPPRFWLDQMLLEWLGQVRNKVAANLVS